jgi:hypothetical protein
MQERQQQLPLVTHVFQTICSNAAKLLVVMGER